MAKRKSNSKRKSNPKKAKSKAKAGPDISAIDAERAGQVASGMFPMCHPTERARREAKRITIGRNQYERKANGMFVIKAEDIGAALSHGLRHA